jgi:hypothetical protein
MVFNLGKIRSTIQNFGQKLTPGNIQTFGTKLRDNALTFGRKVSNTLGKISDVANKLLPMAETAATAMGYGPEVLGFEGVKKGLNMVNNAKQNVDSLRNQGLAFTSAGIPQTQIKPKYNYEDVYNLNSLFKGN